MIYTRLSLASGLKGEGSKRLVTSLQLSGMTMFDESLKVLNHVGWPFTSAFCRGSE